MKKIVILGSTGSIGKSALDVIEKFGGRFKVVGLAARSNRELLAVQAEKFKPEVVAIFDPEAAEGLRKSARCEVLSGEEGVCKVASYAGADFVLSSVVGSAGLMPTISAIRAGKTVGLANKESLVVAGGIVMEEARRSGASIIPVDSEHSAIFQCLAGNRAEHLKRIVLTASGGPFRGRTRRELDAVTPKDALNHPSWSMGRKVTVDSATLMNKGLEVIEAHHLFGVGSERIDVLVHPESIVHSMVEFRDGCCIAQMSVPDMRASIAYAMSYPERLDGVVKSVDFAAMGSLTFGEPDYEAFPCLLLAYYALKEGGTMPAVLNASNEVAVGAFLDGKIGFTDIPVIIKDTMESHSMTTADTLDAVLKADTWARDAASNVVSTLSASRRTA